MHRFWSTTEGTTNLSQERSDLTPFKTVRKWDNLSLRIVLESVQVIAGREDYRGPEMPAETAVFGAAVGASGNKRYSQSPGAMVSQAISRVNDSELIRAAQRGDRAAFESLVRQYDQAVLRLALHLTGSEPDARDIYQEAFLKAYRHIGNFRFECSFYTWIYRIVTNLCLDHLRKRQTRKEDSGTVIDSSGQEVDLLDRVSDDRSGANPERDLMRRELGDKITAALTRLTPRERMVFELKHYQGLRLRTIGEMLNTTEETAKNTLFRATQKLRSALAPMR
jgi:RNA polymerase sigma-70 factor, ECF subfamily